MLTYHCLNCGSTSFKIAGTPAYAPNTLHIFCEYCGWHRKVGDPTAFFSYADEIERQAAQQLAAPVERSPETVGNERPANEPGDVV